jgi:uncharacterized iron-regulated membrane protein
MVRPVLSTTTRIVFRRIHLIVSLVAGLWLAISGLAGSVLVFGDAIDRTLHPSLFARGLSADRAEIDDVVAAAERATGGRAVRVRLASSGSPAHEVLINCAACTRVWVDPNTARVLGVGSNTSTTRGFLHEFHHRMLSGETGEILVGIGGIALLVLSISGIVLSMRRGGLALIFRVQAGNAFRLTWDLHRVVGLVAIPLLVTAALTGLYFVFHTPIDRALLPLTGVDPKPAAVKVNDRRLPLARLLVFAQERFPDARATWLTLPASPSDPLTVRFRQPAESHPNGRTFVKVDPYDGSVVSSVDALHVNAPRRAIFAAYPIHIGTAGGILHRAIVFVAGLLPSALLVSGVWFWLRRSRSARR